MNGDLSQVTELLDQATVLEESLPPPSGPPDLIKPTHELYGEVLLFMDRPKEAQQQFERALFRHPNRARSLLGLARAAAQLGHIQATRQAYANLSEHLETGRPRPPRVTGGKTVSSKHGLAIKMFI